MPPAASTVFDFIAAAPALEVTRYEFEDPTFNAFRQAVRTLITAFTEDESTALMRDDLRGLLLRSLRAPVTFGETDLAPLRRLGEPAAVAARWGDDCAEAHRRALWALEEMSAADGPLRIAVREAITDLLQSGVAVGVFCFRRDADYFRSLADGSTRAISKQIRFMHTARDYREAAPFGALVRVGPLRLDGYASLPPGILSAPRYGSLLQFVWGGLEDDPAVGTDPVMSALNAGRVAPGDRPPAADHWRRRIVRHGSPPEAGTSTMDRDDIGALTARSSGEERRPAALFEFAGGRVWLEPPGAAVLALDVRRASVKRLPACEITQGCFLGVPNLGDVDLGAIRARDGEFSRQWKARLKDRLKASRSSLIEELQKAGVDLDSLASCLRDWAKPASSVIHAPQKKSHFEQLIRTLGIEDDVARYPRPQRSQWWRQAWAEIARSRVDAIHAGVHEHELIAEELLASLEDYSVEIAAAASDREVYVFELPEDRGLAGSVTFHRTAAVELGYRAPESAMRVLMNAERAYEWRV